MLKNKIVVVATAGMLAMCVGLTACGGNASSSAAASSAASSSAAASSEAASSAAASSAAASSAAASSAAASSAAASSEAASSAAASSEAASGSAINSAVAFWEGTLPDGSMVIYVDDAMSGEAALTIAKSDFSDAVAWAGPVVFAENGVVTLSDVDTKETVTFNIVDVTPDSFKIDIVGYGEVELKPVTEAEVKAYAEELAAVAAVEGEKLMKEINDAAKALEKEVTTEVQKLSNEFEKLANEFNNLDEGTIFFWDGTLADGSSVSYMDDQENGEASLTVIKADLSDGSVWYGKSSTSQDGKQVTITNADDGKTITCEIVEAVPDTSMKMKIEGYGEVDLKPVTKADITQLADEIAKSLSEEEAK